MSNEGFCSSNIAVTSFDGLSILAFAPMSDFPIRSALLQTWLVDGTGTGYQEDLKESDSVSPRSILLHGLTDVAIPWGIFRRCERCLLGICADSPPDVDRWFAVLTTHLDRTEIHRSGKR